MVDHDRVLRLANQARAKLQGGMSYRDAVRKILRQEHIRGDDWHDYFSAIGAELGTISQIKKARQLPEMPAREVKSKLKPRREQLDLPGVDRDEHTYMGHPDVPLPPHRR